MNAVNYFLGIGAALLVLASVFEMLRRGKLRERHTLWWLLAGGLGLFLGIFPHLLESIASALGITVPLNLVFFIAIVVLFLVCLQHAAELTRVEERTRILAEQLALMRKQIHELQQDAAATPPVEAPGKDKLQ